jgi:hypothetical protein
MLQIMLYPITAAFDVQPYSLKLCPSVSTSELYRSELTNVSIRTSNGTFILMDSTAVASTTHRFLGWLQGIPTLVVVLSGLIAVAATFVKELSIHAETIRVLEVSSKRLSFWSDWLKAMNCTDQSGPHWDRAQKEFVAAALAAEYAFDNPKSYSERLSVAFLEFIGYFFLIIGIVSGLLGVIQSIARPGMRVILRIECGALSILIALVLIFIARALFNSAKQARGKISNRSARARLKGVGNHATKDK